MISALYNPIQDNRIKIFSHSGYKLGDKQENEIEAYLDNRYELPRRIAREIERVQEFYRGTKQYVDYIESMINGVLMI